MNKHQEKHIELSRKQNQIRQEIKAFPKSKRSSKACLDKVFESKQLTKEIFANANEYSEIVAIGVPVVITKRETIAAISNEQFVASDVEIKSSKNKNSWGDPMPITKDQVKDALFAVYKKIHGRSGSYTFVSACGRFEFISTDMFVEPLAETQEEF